VISPGVDNSGGERYGAITLRSLSSLADTTINPCQLRDACLKASVRFKQHRPEKGHLTPLLTPEARCVVKPVLLHAYERAAARLRAGHLLNYVFHVLEALTTRVPHTYTLISDRSPQTWQLRLI
jgi:hypothetical protein